MIGAPNVKFWILTNKVFPPKIHCLHHSFKQVEEVLDDMFDNLKVKNAMIILAGWMKRGYDNLHPDIFPPSAEAGGEIGLKAFFNNANEKGYLAGVHDNYQDIYPDSSAFKSKPYMKHEDGSPKAGGQWDGGQAYLLCSSEAIHYVKRNISELLSKYSNTVVFIDCTASDQFFECYDSKHPLTRTQDRENRVAIINAVTDKGLLAGSETGMECFVPFMHYFEGMVGSSFGVPVPLFNLVFHDAVISYWHQREPYNRSPKDYVQNFLLDLLYGNPPIWVFKCDSTYWQHKDKFKESYEIVARFHKSVAYDELLEHKWLELGRFRDVQQTTFTSNVEVTINLGRTMYRSPRGWQLQPNGFHVESTLGTMTGVVS
jgi:hypothetical protein